MDQQPSKRPGRPRKALAVPNAAPEGEDAINVNAGNGEIGEAGPAAQTKPMGSNESWGEFSERMRHLAHKEPRLRNVWHPEPKHNMIMCANGNLNVFEGQIKGQLNTGDFIEI